MTTIAARRLRKELVEIHSEGGCPVGMFVIRRAVFRSPESTVNIPPQGIQLVKADDFETWYFTIEVMGESLYKVAENIPAFCLRRCMLMINRGGPPTGRGLHAQIQI